MEESALTKSHIRFAPDILRRLGEELNPHPDQGIIELVKNAYDANARVCTVTLKDTGKAGGTVIVTDDGDGLDGKAIESSWLVLGKSGKAKKDLTRLGRVPAGSKGLGRLAALRLGERATLESRPRGTLTNEFVLDIDWKDFDGASVVEDVDLSIEERARSSTKPGTTIKLAKLRNALSDSAVKRLARQIVLLADPFGDSPDSFRPKLVAKGHAAQEKLVQKRYFSAAQYHVVAELADGKATATVFAGKKRKWTAKHEDIAASRNGKKYNCPQSKFEFWTFLLGAGFGGRKVTIKELRDWLGEVGGVHVYQNRMRVNPYGNPGDDWLEMNRRRVQTPEERPSTNTAIGRVAVDDPKEELMQKTDRTGFIEDDTFHELRAFAQDVLEWLATERLVEAEKRREVERAKRQREEKAAQARLAKAVRRVPAENRRETKQAMQAYSRTQTKKIRALEGDLQLYRTLATAGIVAATFAHESSGNSVKVLQQAAKAVERRGREALGAKYAETIEKPMTSIAKATESLAVLGKATLRIVEADKRRMSRVYVHAVIDDVLSIFEPFFTGRDVDVSKELYPQNPYVTTTRAAVESIVTNLVSNSLTAFERSKSSRARKITIKTEVVGDKATIRVLDSGPGIVGINKKDIWLPGRTTQKNGTGLGLTIVRDSVRDLGGEVKAIEKGDLGGAEFVITIPIDGVE